MKEIIAVCQNYFELLQKTSGVLQECRHCTESISNAIGGIQMVICGLMKCTENSGKISEKQLQFLGKMLVKKVRALSVKINDMTMVEKVRELRSDWNEINAVTGDLCTKLCNESKALLKECKMSQYLYSLCIFSLEA